MTQTVGEKPVTTLKSRRTSNRTGAPASFRRLLGDPREADIPSHV